MGVTLEESRAGDDVQTIDGFRWVLDPELQSLTDRNIAFRVDYVSWRYGGELIVFPVGASPGGC